MNRSWPIAMCFLACLFTSASNAEAQNAKEPESRLEFDAIPDLPEPIGVAGPIVGIHNGVMIVAGGANFGLADDPNLWLPRLTAYLNYIEVEGLPQLHRG